MIKMNKKQIISVVVFFVFLAFGYGFYKFYGSHLKNLSPSLTNITNNSNTPKTLKDLLTSSNPQKCTYPGGMVYVANGKVRVDFNTSENNKNTNSHMIIDGKTSYLWIEGENSGFKMEFDLDSKSATELPKASGLAEAGETGVVDVKKQEDYKCESWETDLKMFNLPSDIIFQDFNSLMPSIPPQNSVPSSSSSPTCDYCNSLSGLDKTECLDALKCNK